MVFFVLAFLSTSFAEKDIGTLPPAKLQTIFSEANRAYDENRFQGAIEGYTSLLSKGLYSKELLFNLANTYFKNGQLGHAILHYRRAWYLSPRDPEIIANLRFALEQSRGLAPPQNTFSALIFKGNRSEWGIIAILCYWFSSLCIAGCLLFRNQRPVIIRILAGCIGVLILSLVARGYWSSYYKHSEVVMLKTSQQALYAPIKNSTIHFEIPEGSILRLEDRSESWIKLKTGKKVGWVPRSSCEMVYPW
ncbi:MAG: hypothetical protein GKR87_00920 [Kiritimatiellae bacterium]|nr:hypothetical protein [Kiritimatiellia bacterium]